MNPDKIFRLDTGAKVFIWLGKNIPIDERKAIATACGKAKSTKPLAVVKQGLEPIDFKEAFGDWLSEAHLAALKMAKGASTKDASEEAGRAIIGTDMEAATAKLLADHKDYEAG